MLPLQWGVVAEYWKHLLALARHEPDLWQELVAAHTEQGEALYEAITDSLVPEEEDSCEPVAVGGQNWWC